METQIKPNELRLGSIILYDGFPNKVVSIMAPAPRNDHFDGKWAVEINPPDSFWVCLDELEPVLIDETWLRRAGIDKRKTGYPYQLSPGYLKIRNGVFFWKYQGVEVELPFVHTFQNFYREIFKSELEFSAE